MDRVRHEEITPFDDPGSDSAVAFILQRSLLPTCPTAAGFDIAAHYLPSHGDLGGDWYDVFELPGDRVGFVMGDVVGHGLYAAIVMGRLRSALRAYALDHDDPAEVLRRLDRKIRHFELGAYATVVYGVTSAPYERFALSSAGHPAPVLVTPGAGALHVALPHDLMLGVMPDRGRHTTMVSVAPGSALLLFTDGLVERRPTTIDYDFSIDDGIRILCSALAHGGDAASICEAAVSTLAGRVRFDDVAVMAVRAMSKPTEGDEG